jgi:hypothetical protein
MAPSATAWDALPLRRPPAISSQDGIDAHLNTRQNDSEPFNDQRNKDERDVEVDLNVEVDLPSNPAEMSDTKVENGYSRGAKQSLFGLILGGSCGAAYGVMDSFGSAEGRRPERFPEAVSNIRMNAMIFGGFFAIFQASKEAARYFRGTKRSDPFDPENTAWATLSITPMALHPVTRKALPSVAFLILIDAINESGIKMY